jgi:hypothetical protein
VFRILISVYFGGRCFPEKCFSRKKEWGFRFYGVSCFGSVFFWWELKKLAIFGLFAVRGINKSGTESEDSTVSSSLEDSL